jgi:CheY-like chemotaxis protein
MTTNRRLEGVVVLVVDDNADSRMVLGRILEKQGAQVLSADGGKSALSILSGVYPDILLTDIAMPEMDGFALVEAIRAIEHAEPLRPVLPAVAVTAFYTDADRRKCFKAGFQRHIPKPIDSTALITAVATLTEHAH